MRFPLQTLIFVLFFLSINFTSSGQIYDLDSLYKNSPQFKAAIDNIKDTFDLFNNDEIMHVRIISDFRDLIKRKYKDEYQPAILETTLFDTIKVKRELKIKSRGNHRRKTCSFPPIKLNFPKKQAIFSQIQEFDKIKLVGNCRAGALYDQYLIQEYYVYKMYNLLTPFSFRVRLLRVEYIDTSGKRKPRDNYAFIIEPTDQMALRLNAKEFDRKGISNHSVDRNISTIMGLFQLMVGNTDWSIPGMHNIKLLRVADEKYPMPIAVPYDFDYCGIINAQYAIPHEVLPIEEVTERFYMGTCREMEEYEEAFKFFHEKRAQFEALFADSPYLVKGGKSIPLNYIDEFYRIIDSKGSVNSIILSTCK
jgi:hypothetical protein